MTVALSGIDDVDWASYEHAYGPATEVPKWLRDMGSEDPATRRLAVYDFESNVNHQGEATPAAIPSVPFLIQLARNPEVPERERLVLLLANLAAGGQHVNALPTGLKPSVDEAWLPEVLTRLHRAIAERADDFVELLGDSDPSVVEATALLVAMLGDEAERFVEPLGGIDAEGNTRLSVNLAVGLVARHTGDPAVAESLPESDDPELALSRAIARATAGAELGDAERERLLEAARTGATATTPWHDGKLGDYAAKALALAAQGTGALDVLGNLLEAVKGTPTSASVASAIVRVVFEDGHPRGELRRTSDYDEGQRQLLDELIDRKIFYDAPVHDALTVRGVWPDRRSVERMLGRQPAGPLDREVEGEPLHQQLRAAMAGRRSYDSLVSALKESCSEADVVALCEDACSGAYHLEKSWPWPPESDYEAVDADELRFGDFVVRILIDLAGAEAVDSWLDRLVDAPRKLRESAVAAKAGHELRGGEALPARYDPVVARGTWNGYAKWLRPVIGALPLDRREKLVLGLDFNRYGSPLQLEGAWPLLDLVPTASAADKLIEHAADPDPTPFPEERAIAILEAQGSAARKPLESAIASGHRRSELLEKALARIA